MPPITLVIADDHPVFRDGLKWIFSLEKEVTVLGEASLGDEVADLVQKTQPDVLLLDFQMPRGEATQILRDVRAKSPGTKVLVLTAFSEEESILKVAKGGARGYVLKGSGADTLILAIKTVHGGGIWVDREMPAADAFEKIARSLPGN